MERTYSFFKLRRIRRYRNKRRATRFYKSLEDDIYKYKKELILDFEDQLHVVWSWKMVMYTMGFIFLFLSVIHIHHFYFFSIYMGISALSVVISLILNNKLQSINRSYILGLSITDQIIKEKQEIIRNTYY